MGWGGGSRRPDYGVGGRREWVRSGGGREKGGGEKRVERRNKTVQKTAETNAERGN